MVIVPMAVVFVLAVIVMGGPTPMLQTVDRYLGDIFASVNDWVRSVV